MSKYEDIINKKYKAIKKDLSGVMVKVKGSVSSKSKGIDQMLKKAAASVDELDSYVKEKWGDISEDLKKSSSHIVKQLHTQKNELIDWYENSISECPDIPLAQEEDLFFNNPKDRKKVHGLIDATLKNMAKISRKPNSVKSLFDEPRSSKRDFAIVVEYLRRSDDEFDNELRKCLYTIESYNELSNKV